VGVLALLVRAAPTSPKVWLLVLVVGVVWIVMSLVFPQRDCRSCGGSNKHRDPLTGRNYHSCGRCDGTGKEWRLVPRLIGRR
jgi:hypothetical protein